MTIQRIATLFNQGRLNLEPGFQRKSVWGIQDRRRLLVSVFNGIPLPTIYLYQRTSPKGRIEYDVIDGKQRVETLLLFSGQGPLVGGEHDPLKFRSDLDGKTEQTWRYWEDLPGDRRAFFRATRVPIITVQGEFSEIAELFVSINSTGRKLTGQEKRHAFHDHSNVLRTATTFADSHADWFRSKGVFSPSQINRMLHIEFCTELLLYAYSGVHQNKKSKLDTVIRGDSLDLDRLSLSVREMGQVINALDHILPHLKTTRFRRRADLYSLLTLLHRYKDEGKVILGTASNRNELASEMLTSFGLSVEVVNERSSRLKNVPADSEIHVDYLRTVKEGTDSASQRRKRERILDDHVLGGVFDQKDVQRSFSEEQRRILWHANRDKRCALCGRGIRSWENMHADHREAYVKGGRTALSNGSITHKKCNLSAGAKK